jgi:hypothetical protein
MKLLTASLLVAAGGFVVLGTTTHARAATMVDLELAFIIDGSDSISVSNFEIQRQAYSNIFKNNFYADVVQPLAGQQLRPGQTGIGKIAVALYQFGQRLGAPDDCSFDILAGRDECTAVDWTIIASQADANDFADRILGPTTGLLKIGGSTAMGAGITQATSGFAGFNMAGITNNNIDSVQQIFDLASDGIDSPPLVPSLLIDPLDAADAALQAGVDIMNTIGTPSSNINFNFLTDLIDVFAGNTNLNGTPGTLFDTQTLGGSYQDILNDKIVNETEPLAASIPEPSLVLGLLSLGLLGIGSKLIKR